MISKKVIIVISGLLLLGTFASVWYLNSKTENIKSEIIDNNPKNSESENTNQLPKINTEEFDRDFTIKFPDSKREQLTEYLTIVTENSMHRCEDNFENELDSSYCKYYFAMHKQNSGLCGDIKDEKLAFACYQDTVFFNLATDFKKCYNEVDPNVKINCLNGVFWAIKTVSNCSIFNSQDIYQACLDSVVFRQAINNQKKDCNEISDQDVKVLCNNLLSPGDADQDGLFDTEEKKIGTNPYRADSDGDGYSDKDELSDGYNPCGEAKVFKIEDLPALCAALKK